MAADRQVQPTEPDKGTDETQRCHHLLEEEETKAQTLNPMCRLAKKAIKTGSRHQVQNRTLCNDAGTVHKTCVAHAH